PSSAFILQSPGTPNCQQYSFSVTFKTCDGKTQTSDVTNDPATVFSTTCGCVTQTSKGKFCLTDSTSACACRQATITATFTTSVGTCSQTATLFLKPAFGGCTSYTSCP